MKRRCDLRNPSTLLSLMKVLVRSLLCQANPKETLTLAQLASIQNHPVLSQLTHNLFASFKTSRLSLVHPVVVLSAVDSQTLVSFYKYIHRIEKEPPTNSDVSRLLTERFGFEKEEVEKKSAKRARQQEKEWERRKRLKSRNEGKKKVKSSNTWDATTGANERVLTDEQLHRLLHDHSFISFFIRCCVYYVPALATADA